MAFDSAPVHENNKEGNIVLRNLLTHENPNSVQYKQLIQEAAESHSIEITKDQGFHASFDMIWVQNITSQHQLEKSPAKEILEFLRGKLEGKVLVDLAAGGGMRYLSERVKVSTQIEVNLYHGRGLPNPYNDISHGGSSGTPSVKVIKVKADALDFTSKIANNSASFVINGLDTEIIPVVEYHKVLADEVIRATPEGGVIFGLNSGVLNFVAGNPQVEAVHIGGYEFFVKKKQI